MAAARASVARHIARTVGGDACGASCCRGGWRRIVGRICESSRWQRAGAHRSNTSDIASGPCIGAFGARAGARSGALGTFDDAGVTSSCLVSVGERRYLYYTGWTRGVSVPFYLHVGLAISENNGPFRRLSRAPLLDRNPADPYLTASPCVRVDGDGWKMWYVSGSEWKATDAGPRHYYNIRYAESMDGVVWHRDGRTCVDYANETEHAFARPCVIRDADRFRMW